MTLSLDAYHAWRRRQGSDYLLHEGEPERPKERLLQYVWQHQRLRRGLLTMASGQECEILHPGFWNHGPGPDFSRALIRFEGESIKRGDIEIDCEVGGWKAHGHDRNPAFSKVILQVVWQTSERAPMDRPILALEPNLDDSLEVLTQLFAHASPELPREFRGRCHAPLFDLPLDEVRDVLRTAALFRFQYKACLLESRARLVGWRLALWEGMVAGLGYSRNTWPMRLLGERVGRLFSGFPDEIPLQLTEIETEAILFGTSGFLPAELRHPGSRYVIYLWDAWWRLQDRYRELVLPRGVWQTSGLRPHNHPHRRVALVARWMRRPDFFQSLEYWFTAASEANSLPMLLNALSVVAPPFWATHFNFSRESLGASPHLIGEPRLIDLAVNVILPWFWIRAKSVGNEVGRKRAEALFFSMPRSEENRLLKDGRRRLLGRSDPKMLGRAAEQQGLLQVLRDFCAHSNALCDGCHFPDLIRSHDSDAGAVWDAQKLD